jgi:hypothetical protein
MSPGLQAGAAQVSEALAEFMKATKKPDIVAAQVVDRGVEGRRNRPCRCPGRGVWRHGASRLPRPSPGGLACLLFGSLWAAYGN